MTIDAEPLHHDLRKAIHRQLVDAPGSRLDPQSVRDVVGEFAPLLSNADQARLTREVLSDIEGLGPLDDLLGDPEVTDVMVIANRGVWVERGGVLASVGMVLDTHTVEHLIERVVAPLGLRVDRASPMVDARLKDGSRVNAVVHPLAIDGPCLTIRRFSAKQVPLSSFCSEAVAGFLAQCVRGKKNIVVSGGTGAGKTTLLNALASNIPTSERIVTIEDAAELRLGLPHVVRLESRPANTEGVGKVTIHELLRNALRMRPDRIIVGECRGPEALDMLQAMNTGHDGSFSTCHANSPQDALARLETMVLSGSVNIPLAAVQQQIASAIDLIVQVSRTGSVQRRIVDIAQVSRNEGQICVKSLLGNGLS